MELLFLIQKLLKLKRGLSLPKNITVSIAV